MQKRLKISRITLFFKGYFLISNTQTLGGVTSRVVGEKRIHYIFWDFDKCTLGEIETKLGQIQREFGLGNIYVTSDLEGSYRVWCSLKGLG